MTARFLPAAALKVWAMVPMSAVDMWLPVPSSQTMPLVMGLGAFWKMPEPWSQKP
ncbi:hypothetical protein D3C78_1529660 [compost metagenome]